jgi:hypothetical protein
MLAVAVGCGGKATPASPIQAQGKPIDPSGNWKLVFSDSNNNQFLMSGLFSQTGAVVTGLSFSEVGNAVLGCLVQRDVSMSNGLVQNVSNFTRTLAGNFGTIAFNTTLNDAGTHAAGTYTITPGANGNCLGLSLTGSLVADEIPSMSGTWTGTVSCIAVCPTGGTTGTVQMVLTQDGAAGAVSGTYTVAGLDRQKRAKALEAMQEYLTAPAGRFRNIYYLTFSSSFADNFFHACRLPRRDWVLRFLVSAEVLDLEHKTAGIHQIDIPLFALRDR